MATEAQNPSSLEANPRKALDAQDSPTEPSPLNDSLNGKTKDAKESKEGAPVVSSTTGDAEGPETDIQKKMRRAERFGVRVQLSEEEKRSTRAERFGTGSTMPGSKATKKSEDQKRKARAERFGLPVESTPADEEAKKKARLARFGQVSKADSVEEDKRKTRAMRFSAPMSNSLSKVEAKGELESAAVLGKASGGV